MDVSAGLVAELAEHTVSWARDGDYPVIHPKPGSVAKGRVFVDVDERALAALNFYEGGYGYALTPVGVETEDGVVWATVYYPPEGQEVSGPWSLDDWVATSGPLAVEAAGEAVSYLGQITPEVLAGRMPQIRARAQARLNAAMEDVPQTRFTRDDVILGTQRRAYANFFILDELDLTFRLFDGSLSAPVTRAVFVGGDAAIVLPYDPVRDVVMVVEQFRAPPYVRGDKSPWMAEPIAGRLDAGESAEDAAYREAREEAGLSLSALHEVARGYPSPGASSEHFSLFVGIADLPEEACGVGGLAGEDEDISSEIIGFEDFIARVEAGAFRVIPLIACAYWLAMHRARLRKEHGGAG